VLNCGTHHNVVRFLPPIDVTSQEISTGLELFAAALRSVPQASA
jgi:4-aminobutyrate aminotransferase-like enzyme